MISADGRQAFLPETNHPAIRQVIKAERFILFFHRDEGIIPVGFLPGPVGVFYRQFSITMATAIIISGVVALTLTPALCAMLLRPHVSGKFPIERAADALNELMARKVAGKVVLVNEG